MTFSYWVGVQHQTMHRLGLQYIRIRYQGIEITDAVVFDKGTGSETELSGASPFTGSEFLQSFDVCLRKASFLAFCTANGFDPDYITSANMGGWEIAREGNDVFEAVQTLGDRTANVAEYYIKLVTTGVY